MPLNTCAEKPASIITAAAAVAPPPGLQDLGAFGLLRDGPIVLRLALGHSRVRMEEEGRPDPQRSQELLGRHQVAVTRRVGEGVAGAAGADSPGGGTARCRGRRRLVVHLIPHLLETVV